MNDFRDVLVRYKWAVLLILLALALGACADLAKPETTREKLAYAEAGLTSAYVTIGDLKRAGRISAESRDELVAKTDTAGAALDASRVALNMGDLDTAAAKLRLAQDALRLLQATLRGLGG